MTRIEEMNAIAKSVEAILLAHSHRKDITIEYEKTDRDTIQKYTDFERRYHRIAPGDEYFMLYENVCGVELLYVVNVSMDSALTAASELMNLIANKF